jgi:Protein of unknown function (DUF1552)
MKSRRDFLKSTALGAGALSLTPCFNAFGATAPTNGFPKRFIFIRKSNGERPNEVAPVNFSAKDKALDDKKQALELDLDNLELPTYLRPLAAHKADMCILQGLSSKMSENGHYSYSSVMGAYHSSRNSLSCISRATIDFELASLFPSPFGHVELSLTGNYDGYRNGIVSGYSASAAHQRNYCYADPETAHNELFRVVTNPSAVNSENKMLNFLEEDEEFKAKILQGYEKQKLSGHLSSIDSIRIRNEKLAQMAGSMEKHIPKLADVHVNGGAKASTVEKMDAMTDILCASLISGLTNVVTYVIDDLGLPISGLPGLESERLNLHSIGHGEGGAKFTADQLREQLRIAQIKQIARIVERLKATPEGKGTMFDNTMIMYFPEGGETHHASGVEAPFVVMAGSNCALDLAGRYIRLPHHGTQGHKTLGNWYTTLLNAHGNPIKHYGDFDQEIARLKIDQSGPIKEFMM